MKICPECKDVIMYCKCIEEYFEKERKESEMIDYRTDETELIKKAKEIEGKKIFDLGEKIGLLDKKERRFTKSIIANIVETNFFGIPTNTHPTPDFSELGIELKVSPLKYVKSRNLYNMKERCVISLMDYNDVYKNENWKESKVYKKINKILFVFYIHDNNIPANEWKFAKTFLWTPNKDEVKMISNDYKIIRDNILNGIINSERHNTFLGTCPKHAGGYKKDNISQSVPQSLREHPILGQAEKRAFCIKQREVDRLIGKHTNWKIIKEKQSIGFRNIE
tara:strand:- start:227 stop:1063 length:837 start_codon:yes stop_codon:yes gene_type:complete